MSQGFTQDFNSDPDIITLASELSIGQCILFVGAGVSISAGLPSWKTLESQMLQKLSLDPDLDYGGPLRIAGYCQRILGGKFYDFIIEQLQTAKNERPIHDFIAELPCNIFITTNYDTLLEESLRRLGGFSKVNVISSDQDLKIPKPITIDNNKQNAWVIKMHGCKEKNKHEIVITEKDYLNYGITFKKLSNLVSQLITNHSVLFIGYSLSDWNIAKILYEHSQNIEEYGTPKYFIQIGQDHKTNASMSRLIATYQLKPIILACDSKDDVSTVVLNFLKRLKKMYTIPQWLMGIICSLVGYDMSKILKKDTRLSEVFNVLEATLFVRFILKIEKHLNICLDLPHLLHNMDKLTIAELIDMVDNSRQL